MPLYSQSHFNKTVTARCTGLFHYDKPTLLKIIKNLFKIGTIRIISKVCKIEIYSLKYWAQTSYRLKIQVVPTSH